MPNRHSEIFEQMTEVRGLVNEGRKHHELCQDKAKFSQICSSMDVIEDTEQAITAFQRTDFGRNVALGYLTIYGVLQALFLQQDAVANLHEARKVKKLERPTSSLTTWF